MHKQHSNVIKNQNPLNHHIAQKLAIAAGVAFSLGFINTIPSETNRFEFQHQVGDHLLSGKFVGTDKNENGVIELSEVDSFEASWGDYSWTKEDLEAFSWGNQAISQNQGKTFGINGLNLFARGRQHLKSHALQVWNREVNTPDVQSKNQGIYGIEYAANTPDKPLFSQDQFSLEVNRRPQSSVDVSALMVLLLLGTTGLAVLNPCWLQWETSEGKPCSSEGKI